MINLKPDWFIIIEHSPYFKPKRQQEETMEKNAADFTTGKIFGPLFKFAGPVFIAMFLQVMYGAVDLLIVGKFGITADVSAVSTGSLLTTSITRVIVCLSMGITILIGQFLGEGRKEECGSVIGGGIVLFFCIAAALSLLIPFCAPGLARLFNAPAEAFSGTVAYLRICMYGAVFIVAYNVLGSIMRGMGDSRTPLLSVIIACVLNIAGDYLLVAVFGMGSAGAAIATVFAQAVSVAICLLVIAKRKLPFRFTGKDIRFHKEIIASITKLGAPLALQEMLLCISFLVILSIANSIGLIVSAGVGIAEKICGFVMLIPMSLSQALSAFIAQNFGAGKDDRSVKSLRYAQGVSFAISLFMFWMVFFHGEILTGLFANDTDVIHTGAEYLKAYAIDCILAGFMFCFNGYFNGCGRTRFVMVQGTIGSFGVRIPIAYIMSQQIPVNVFHIGLATPAATFIQCILCSGYFILMHRNFKIKHSLS